MRAIAQYFGKLTPHPSRCSNTFHYVLCPLSDSREIIQVKVLVCQFQKANARNFGVEFALCLYKLLRKESKQPQRRVGGRFQIVLQCKRSNRDPVAIVKDVLAHYRLIHLEREMQPFNHSVSPMLRCIFIIKILKCKMWHLRNNKLEQIIYKQFIYTNKNR